MADPHSFDAVNDHVNALPLALSGERAAAAGLTLEQQRGGLCESYHAARPVLAALAAIPFIPARWRAVVSNFLGVLDTLCPL